MLFVGGLATLLLTSFVFAQKDVDVASTAEGDNAKAHRGLPAEDGPHGVKFPSPLRDSIREGPTPLGRFTKPLIAGVKTAEVVTDSTDSAAEDGGDVEPVVSTPEPETVDVDNVTSSTEATTTVVTTPANALSRLLSKKKTNAKPEPHNKKAEGEGRNKDNSGRSESAAETSATRSLPGRRQRNRGRTEPRVTTAIPSTEAPRDSAESGKSTASPKSGNKRFGGSRLSLGRNKFTTTPIPAETDATSESQIDSTTSAAPLRKAPLSKFQPRRPIVSPSRAHEAPKVEASNLETTSPSNGRAEASSEPSIAELNTEDFKRTQPIRRRRPNLNTRGKHTTKVTSSEHTTTPATETTTSEHRPQVPDKRKGLFSSRPSKHTTTSAATSPRTGLDESGELTLGTTHLPNEDLTISKNTVQGDEAHLLGAESRLTYQYHSFGDNDPIIVQLEGDDMFAEGSRRFPFVAPSRVPGLRTRVPEEDQNEQQDQPDNQSEEEVTEEEADEKEEETEEGEEKEELVKETITPSRPKKVKNTPKEQPAQETPSQPTNSFLARLGERRKMLGLRSGSINKQKASPVSTDSDSDQTSEEAQEVAPSEERFITPEPKRTGRRNLRPNKFRSSASAAEASDEVVAEGARHSPLTVVDTNGGEVKDAALEEEDDASPRVPKRTLLPRKNFALASLLSTRRQSSTEKDSSESSSGEVTEPSVSDASKETVSPKVTKKPPRKSFSKSPKIEEQTEEPIQKEEESKEETSQQEEDLTTKPTLVGNHRRPVGGGLKDLLSRRKPGGGRLPTPINREHNHPKEETSDTSENKRKSESVEDKPSRFRQASPRPSRNRFQPKTKPESNDADHDIEERLQKLEEKESQTSSKKKFESGRPRPKFGKHKSEKTEEVLTESKEIPVKEQPTNRPGRRPNIRKGEHLLKEQVTEKIQEISITEAPVVEDTDLKVKNDSKELNMTEESSTEMDIDTTTILISEESETTTMEGIMEMLDSEVTEPIVGITVIPEMSEALDEASEKAIDFLNVKPVEEDKNIRTSDVPKESESVVLVEEDKSEIIPQEEEIEVPVVRRKGGRRRRKNRKNKKQQQEGQEDDSPIIEEGSQGDFESSRSGLKQIEFDYPDQIWETVDSGSLDIHQPYSQLNGDNSPFSRDNTEVLPSPDS